MCISRLLLLFLPLLGARAADRIVLTSGEQITSSSYSVDLVISVIGKRTVARPLIRAIYRGGATIDVPDSDSDVVALRSGERRTGHILYASDSLVRLDAEALPADRILAVSFARGKPGDWALETASSGGFSGRGGPGVTVTSYGYARVTRMGLGGVPSPVKPELLAPIDAAVRAAHPAKWRASYVPPTDSGCCDRFHIAFNLNVVGPDGNWILYSTSWFEPNKFLPLDMEEIRDQAMKLTQRK